MKKLKTYILLVILLGAFACKEKDLELQPTTESASAYYKTDAQVQTALWAAYDPMQWVGNWGTTQITWGNVASDDAFAGGADENDQRGFQASDTYIASPSDPDNDLDHMWKNWWQAINRCDQIIYNTAEPFNPIKKKAIAEAKFLKAQYYFYLSRNFGGLPFWRKLPLPDEQFERKTQDSTFYFIEELLVQAIASGDMAERKSQTDPSEGTATKGSAQGYLAKVYMYHGSFYENGYQGNTVDVAKAKEIYQKAIDVMTDIENSGQYALLANYQEIFLHATKHCVESLFEVNFSSLSTHNNFDRADGNTEDRLYGPRSNSVKINGQYDFGWGFNQPTKDLVDAYKAQNDIIRLNASCVSSDSLERLHRIYWLSTVLDANGNLLAGIDTTKLRYKYAKIAWVNERSKYWDNKHYINPAYNPGNTNILSGHNRVLIRLADIYLMLAEAYNRLGQDDKAKTYLNLVRARVNLAAVTSTGTALFDAIKLERRLELAHEGDRYFDLVRWGDALANLGVKNPDKGIEMKPHQNWTEGRPGKDSYGLWPIPQIEINKTNPRWNNNPGY
jgi:starch-binding outer membrane protein, SusD/RagB family